MTPRINIHHRHKYLTRRPDPFFDQADKLHAERIGQVLILSNFLHSELCEIFQSLVNPADKNIGKILWVRLNSDSSQRSALRSLVNVARIKKTLRTQILWTLNHTEKLAEQRNKAAHIKIGYLASIDGPIPMPDPFHTEAKDFQWLESNWPRILKLLQADYRQLSAYANAINAEISDPGNYGPMPQRPKLSVHKLYEQFKKSRNQPLKNMRVRRKK